jgi:hypothetical protein
MKFKYGNLKGRDHFGHRGMDREIILKWILNVRYEAAGWIPLAKDTSSGGLL